MNNPARIVVDTVVMSIDSRDSGNRCKNEPPSIAPADRLTMFNSLFFVNSWLNITTNTPISEIRLIAKTLTMVYNNVRFKLISAIK